MILILPQKLLTKTKKKQKKYKRLIWVIFLVKIFIDDYGFQNLFVYQPKFNTLQLREDKISKCVVSWKSNGIHCVKSVDPYLPAFGLNTESYSVSLHIQFECGKTRTRINPNTDTFYAVMYTSRLFLTSGTLLPIIKYFGHKIGLQFINSALEKNITQPKS